jgi:hypothetical protein
VRNLSNDILGLIFVSDEDSTILQWLFDYTLYFKVNRNELGNLYANDSISKTQVVLKTQLLPSCEIEKIRAEFEENNAKHWIFEFRYDSQHQLWRNQGMRPTKRYPHTISHVFEVLEAIQNAITLTDLLNKSRDWFRQASQPNENAIAS